MTLGILQHRPRVRVLHRVRILSDLDQASPESRQAVHFVVQQPVGDEVEVQADQKAGCWDGSRQSTTTASSDADIPATSSQCARNHDATRQDTRASTGDRYVLKILSIDLPLASSSTSLSR
jgi:hypothetical protein